MRLDTSTHTYYDDQGEPVRYSATQFISRFFHPFRAHAIASSLARKRGMETVDIMAEWRDTAIHGSQVHEHIHNWLNGIDDETPNGTGTVGGRVRAKRNAQAEFLADLVQARQAVGVRGIRLLRAANSTYRPLPLAGALGEEVIVDSQF